MGINKEWQVAVGLRPCLNRNRRGMGMGERERVKGGEEGGETIVGM